jgi:hypothetical protein
VEQSLETTLIDLPWNEQLQQKIFRDGFSPNRIPTIERHDRQLDMAEDFSARPFFRIVVVCRVAILLELDERVRNRPQVPDGDVVGMRELFAARSAACVVHLPMIERASECSSLARPFPIRHGGCSEQMKKGVVRRRHRPSQACLSRFCLIEIGKQRCLLD